MRTRGWSHTNQSLTHNKEEFFLFVCFFNRNNCQSFENHWKSILFKTNKQTIAQYNLLLPNTFFFKLPLLVFNSCLLIHLNCFQGFCEYALALLFYFLNVVMDLFVYLAETIYKFLEVKLLSKSVDFKNGKILANCSKKDSSNYYPTKSVWHYILTFLPEWVL